MLIFSKLTRIVLTVRMRKSSRRSPGNFHIFCCSLKPSCRRFSLLKVAFHGTSGFREESRDITALTAFLRDEYNCYNLEEVAYHNNNVIAERVSWFPKK